VRLVTGISRAPAAHSRGHIAEPCGGRHARVIDACPISHGGDGEDDRRCGGQGWRVAACTVQAAADGEWNVR